MRTLKERLRFLVAVNFSANDEKRIHEITDYIYNHPNSYDYAEEIAKYVVWLENNQE